MARTSTSLLTSLFLLLPCGLGLSHAAIASEALATPSANSIEYPDGMPPSPQLIELGKTLFFDKRLSGNMQQSCATCHNPEKGFGDGMAKGLGSGGNTLGRNTPHLYNLAWNVVFFWDGRAATLEQQALGPIQSDKEMNMQLEKLLPRLQEVPFYRERFRENFGSEEITAERLAKAIAAFERTIISNQSPFDKYLAGDKKAMNPAAVRGLKIFEGKGNCTQCHDGANFTDNSFHNIGIKGSDKGRATIVNEPSLTGAFKTPGLRNVALTAPYMHDGSLATLDDVVRYYNRGGDDREHADKLMKPLNLSAKEMNDLVAFLNALTSPVVVKSPPIP